MTVQFFDAVHGCCGSFGIIDVVIIIVIVLFFTGNEEKNRILGERSLNKFAQRHVPESLILRTFWGVLRAPGAK